MKESEKGGEVLSLHQVSGVPTSAAPGAMKAFIEASEFGCIDDTGKESRPPQGLWRLLGKGPTTIANNTEVTVLADQTFADGEVPMMLVLMRDTPSNEVPHQHVKTSGGISADKLNMSPIKKPNGKVDFRIKHKEGSTRVIDWLAYKVLPP